ncbi:hypothetical protein PMZ80_001481 [Knufia obscura]|uniref:Uncharacterized protein n=2 Tax=Knufia TaxID=430999 RepID=A0AAN8EHJ9_9EURO|nr:hypothetical protein PMZ80_001481 [Knufia obscura]KAK5955698.1 hypothetical protein OHC33_003339 [Knufia fluminis]
MTDLPPIKLLGLTAAGHNALDHELTWRPHADLRLILKKLCSEEADVATRIHRVLCQQKAPPLVSPSRQPGMTMNSVTPTNHSDKDYVISRNSLWSSTALDDHANDQETSNKRRRIDDTNAAWTTSGEVSSTLPTKDTCCVNCGELFNNNLTSDQDLECLYHTGNLEQVDEYWENVSEYHDGALFDVVEERNEHPEGVMWDCCGKTWRHDGCSQGRHIPPLLGRTMTQQAYLQNEERAVKARVEQQRQFAESLKASMASRNPRR